MRPYDIFLIQEATKHALAYMRSCLRCASMMLGLVLYYNVNGALALNIQNAFSVPQCIFYIVFRETFREFKNVLRLCSLYGIYRKLVTNTVAGTPSPMAIVYSSSII